MANLEKKGVDFIKSHRSTIVLLALLFMPASNLWSRTLFAFATAILGTWVFVWFIQRIRFKDLVMVPLVGIVFGNVIGGITSYLAYKYEMTQALSSWLVGHFSLVLKGRYEIVWLTVPLVILAFLFANHFNIVGLGRDFSQNLGVPYNLVLFSGLTLSAMITAIDYMKICIQTTLIISKKPGNTGISRDIRTEFTTDLLLSD